MKSKIHFPHDKTHRIKQYLALLLGLVMLALFPLGVLAKDELTITSPWESKISAPSKEVVIKGTAPAGSKIQLTFNTDTVFKDTVGKSGIYIFTVEMKDGTNKISITATDSKGIKYNVDKTYQFTLKKVQLEKKSDSATASEKETKESEEESLGFIANLIQKIKQIFSGE